MQDYTHLYSAFGFPLDELDLIPTLTHHVFDFIGRKLQLKVRLFFAITVWRQQLIQLRDGRLLPILQRQQMAGFSYQSPAKGKTCHMELTVSTENSTGLPRMQFAYWTALTCTLCHLDYACRCNG